MLRAYFIAQSDIFFSEKMNLLLLLLAILDCTKLYEPCNATSVCCKGLLCYEDSVCIDISENAQLRSIAVLFNAQPRPVRV